MITLTPMTQDEFNTYEQRLAAAFADDQIKSGTWDASTAFQQALDDIRQELPDGLATPNNEIYQVRHAAIPEPVGQLWVKFNEDLDRSAFIIDIEIYPAYQRRGYAQQTLAAPETLVKTRGIYKIGLHVHAFNSGAQALYEKSGYTITGYKMLKQLRHDT